MLFMEQANRGPGKENGRTGEKGVIVDVSDKPHSVCFRSRIHDLKAHMTQEVNPLTSTFVVDAYVQHVSGEPKGYVITGVHNSIRDDDPMRESPIPHDRAFVE
jgi:hypothetical protein